MEGTTANQTLKQTFNLLKYTFVIVPIVAGADKFFNELTNWEKYLGRTILRVTHLSAMEIMMAVGVIEIIAGLIVLVKPKIGGYIVAAWLTLIALSLLAGFNFLDVAVRDLVMAISAFAMARIAGIVNK